MGASWDSLIPTRSGWLITHLLCWTTGRVGPRPGRRSSVAMELSEVAAARRDPGLAVLEGFRAVKRAIRFGAELEGAWTADAEEVLELTRRLAPDVRIPVQVVEGEALRAVVPRAQLVAVARRPTQPDADAMLAGPGHVVLLEDPRHLGNLGAAVRVAA